MTSIRLRRSQVVVLAWTGLSFLLSLLPQGVGGAPRVVNAVLFMALGPACALMVLLLDRGPPPRVTPVRVGSSPSCPRPLQPWSR